MQLPSLISIKAPCELSLACILSDGSSLHISRVVRVVRGKRLVCVGLWNDQTVYAKLFLGQKAAYYATRDAMGVKALMRADILTPPLLFETHAQDVKPQSENSSDRIVSILIFQAYSQSENIEVLWQKSQSAERLYFAKKLCQTVGQHHLKNLIQTDLYLKNFLLLNDDIVTLDGDGIRQFASLSQAQAIENLSILLSKFDVLEVKSWLIQLLESYQTANPNVRLVPQTLSALSNQFRLQAASRYADKKVFRQCSDVFLPRFKYSSGLTAYFVAFSTVFLAVFEAMNLKTLDQLVESATMLKKGNTCTVVLANIAEKPIVVKRYNIKNVGHQFSRLFRQSRAAVSWANAHRLQLLGIATPKPVALIEQRLLGMRSSAYFLSEYIEAPDVDTFFAITQDKILRAEAVKNICQLFYRLHFLGISHGDMKASNLKIMDGAPIMIDLDSMQQHRSRYYAEKSHAKDLRRFMQNWKEDASLYNAFLKGFKVIYADHTPLLLANILS